MNALAFGSGPPLLSSKRESLPPFRCDAPPLSRFGLYRRLSGHSIRIHCCLGLGNSSFCRGKQLLELRFTGRVLLDYGGGGRLDLVQPLEGDLLQIEKGGQSFSGDLWINQEIKQ